MGKIDKNANMYVNDKLVASAPIIGEKQDAPVSRKYPGSALAMLGVTSKGKHVGSHKPIKNHRGETVPRH